MIVAAMLAAMLPMAAPTGMCGGRPDAGGLKRFLESQYVGEAGLLRASVTSRPDNTTIYLANDNILAARALEALGSPKARMVLEALSRYNLTWNNKTDILVAHSITGKFYANRTVTLGHVGPYTVKWDGMNPSKPMRDWRLYADLLVYHALNSLLHGDKYTAEEDYIALISMWDGWGFHDNSFNQNESLYDSYKLALAYYLHRALKAAGSSVPRSHEDLAEQWSRLLACLQDEETGGIIARYTAENGRLKPVGDANTETASMTVLAFYSKYPEIIGSKHNTHPILTPRLAVLAATLLSATLIYAALRKRREPM